MGSYPKHNCTTRTIAHTYLILFLFLHLRLFLYLFFLFLLLINNLLFYTSSSSSLASPVFHLHDNLPTHLPFPPPPFTPFLLFSTFSSPPFFLLLFLRFLRLFLFVHLHFLLFLFLHLFLILFFSLIHFHYFLFLHLNSSSVAYCNAVLTKSIARPVACDVYKTNKVRRKH